MFDDARRWARGCPSTLAQREAHRRRSKVRLSGAFFFPQPWHAVPMRALTIALCLLATPALADVAGVASVIDGDTIEVHGQRIG